MLKVADKVREQKEEIISLRRMFHQYPELSSEEYKTAERIIEQLEAYGIPYKRIGVTGVVGMIEGATPGKTLMLRADMDALAVQEDSPVPYASKIDGIMHACGHDGHMATLLVAAKILNGMKDEISGTIVLNFQPAEETVEGALVMIEGGVLEGVDAAFGIHIWNDIEVGKVSIEAGPRMAASDIFKIKVTGKGGHGALPHQCIDPVLVAANIVTNLQSIVSRNMNPNDAVVVTVGSIHAGTQGNIIPHEAVLEGTVRYFNSSLSQTLKERISSIAKGTASTFSATVEIDYLTEMFPLINHPDMSKRAEQVLHKLYGEKTVTLLEKMTSNEDFAFYADKIPSVFAFVGSKNEEKLAYYPHHHPRFDIDEDALVYSSQIYVQFALDFLSE